MPRWGNSSVNTSAVATAVAAAVPSAADIEVACEEALIDKVDDLTIPGANTPYNAALAAIAAKVGDGTIQRADLSVATVTIAGGATGDIVAAVPGQVVKLYAFDVYAATSMDGSARWYDGAAADIGGSATALHSSDHTVLGLSVWSHPEWSKPRFTTSSGKGLSLDNTNGIGPVQVTALYKQE